MNSLNKIISQCEVCKNTLPQAPKPILQLSTTAKIIVIGQAPGRLAHQSGKPWNDKSGERLRQWLNLSDEVFYDKNTVAIVPMGFCYPGKGESGDLAPRKECAPLWHPKILEILPNNIPRLLIGNYAQNYYLHDNLTLTQRCFNWVSYAPKHMVLPHPSPRNNIWIKKNPWFETEVLPEYRSIVQRALGA